MKPSRRLVTIPAAVAVLCLMAGCTMPFSGERNVEFNVNILGNTVHWKSDVAGQYTADAAAVETPTTK